MVSGFLAGAAGGATVAIVIKAVDQFSKVLTKAQKQMAAVGAAMIAVGTIGVIAMGKAVKSSSNLQESVNALNVVFGKSAKAMLELSDTATKSFGLSKRAFNEGAVRFSAFAKIIAEDGGDVVDVIKEITGRTADFASVMNIDLSRAQILVQAGLAGETEGLRRFGIDVSAATTKAFAYSKGIGDGSRELTEQEKILARYGLILEQTDKFVGDFVNTSDDLANSQRILAADMENASAAIGEGLLPIVEVFIGALRTLVGWFSKLSDTTKQTIGIIIAVTSVVFILTGAIILMTIAATTLNIALLPLTAIIFGIIAAITLVILIILNWKKILVFLTKIAIKVANFMILTWTRFADTWRLIWAGVGNVVKFIWNGILSFIEASINAIIGIINTLIEGLNKVPGINIPIIPDLDLGGFKAEMTDLGALARDLLDKQNKLKEDLSAAEDAAISMLEDKLGIEKEITEQIEKQQEAVEVISKEQELVNKLQGFVVDKISGEIFNPRNFRESEFKTRSNFEAAKEWGGVTITIENVIGLDPEEISQALSAELNNKLSL